MTNNTQQELEELRDVAKPFRYRVILNKDEEAVLPGVHGRVEWYSFNGKTLVGFTKKKRILHKLLSLSWVTPHQVGDTEGSFLFLGEQLGAIGKILKLKKLSGAMTAPHLAQYYFQPRNSQPYSGGILVKVG